MLNKTFITIFFAAFLLQPVRADVTTYDVYVALENLSANVHEVRREMGIAPHSIAIIEIYNAQPREVYFQAQTVLEKVSRLHFDILRDRPGKPILIGTDARPADVLALVQEAAALISAVQQHMKIESISVIPDQETADGKKTPTDVYVLMVDLSRMLNEMIDQRFSPADAYQQVTYAIGIASSVLLHEGNTQPLGNSAPTFERRKTPTDVYRKLITINNLIHEVVKKHGGDCLLVGPSEMERSRVIPGDVYDLASLVVAELNHLHNLVGSTIEPHAPYYPGRKLPSDVYQRVTQLHSQVTLLLGSDAK